jgi:histidinol dehydrogenase
MQILRHDRPGYAAALQKLKRSAATDLKISAIVAEIISAVRQDGDEALRKFTGQFDGIHLTKYRVTNRELSAARSSIDAATRHAISIARKNVEEFARQSLRKSWTMCNRQGVEIGERFDPFDRVGIYVPGGTAPLVSTAVMTVTLARTAGVPEIVATTPADKSGKIAAPLLYALEFCGATEIYKVGGAQAIAALAFGTRTIRPVRKIFGPGNAFVVEAKRQVFGQVGIDLLPGPSEIVVIADRTANPSWIAADLLAQAEHGKGSSAMLLTDSLPLLEEVVTQVQFQIERLSRREHLMDAVENGVSFVLVRSLGEAVKIANEFAPEHLSIVARNEKRLARDVKTAGAIFLGGYSPVAGGDFVAGPSHELPTGGAGKAFSGLTVDQFQRRTSLLRFDRQSLEKSLPIIQKFSEIEGLDAHGASAAIRLI